METPPRDAINLTCSKPAHLKFGEILHAAVSGAELTFEQGLVLRQRKVSAGGVGVPLRINYARRP